MAENKVQDTASNKDTAVAKGGDAPSGNTLALNDVLADTQADSCNVTSNLHFRFDSTTGNTVVDVKSPDSAGATAQQIVLQGVDLTSGGSLSDSQVIQLLLAGAGQAIY